MTKTLVREVVEFAWFVASIGYGAYLLARLVSTGSGQAAMLLGLALFAWACAFFAGRFFLLSVLNRWFPPARSRMRKKGEFPEGTFGTGRLELSVESRQSRPELGRGPGMELPGLVTVTSQRVYASHTHYDLEGKLIPNLFSKGEANAT